MKLLRQRFILLLAAALACACAAEAEAADGAAAPIRDVYVIHIIIDGTNRQAFDAALAEGKLPTIRRQLAEGGATFARALSLFPTTSTSVYQAFTTGLFPGHAGIPHLERFDRERREVIGYLTTKGFRQLNRDLINLRALRNPDVAELTPPTSIFELLHGYPTAAVYSSFSRGAAERFPRIAPAGALWDTYVAGRPELVDVLAMRRVMDLFSRPAERIPRYTLVGLYSSDIMGHKHGPESVEVKEVLEQFDLFLREFRALLAERGIADKTYIIVSADHGMHETGKLFRLNEALAERGIAVKPRSPRDKDYAIYAANRGVVSSHAYVRHGGGFEPLEDPELLRRVPTRDGGTVDLIELLLSLEATDLVIVREGKRSARIFGRGGISAEVTCTAVAQVDYCSYRPGSGDPLGYRADPALARLADGQPHSSFAWREGAAAAHYPDAVVQFVQIFDDGRAGDLFITTRGRYGFRKVKEGNHGGPTEEDMQIPLLIAGPGVAPGACGVARAVDLYPLLLAWFGLSVPAGNHDGRDPFAPFPGEDPIARELARLDLAVARGEPTPQIAPRDRGALRSLAADELRRRGKLVGKLRELRAQDAAPKAIDDYQHIVQRELAQAEAGQARMEAIAKLLLARAPRGGRP